MEIQEALEVIPGSPTACIRRAVRRWAEAPFTSIHTRPTVTP